MNIQDEKNKNLIRPNSAQMYLKKYLQKFYFFSLKNIISF